MLFVVYCAEAGVLFTLLPWTGLWEGALAQVPGLGNPTLGLHPILRGLVSGFGLIHLVWGVHDLEQMLPRRRG